MKLAKFLLSILVIYFVLNYYNIFSITKGLTQGASKEDLADVLTIEEFKYIKISDDTYWIMYETDDNLYFETADSKAEVQAAIAAATFMRADVDEVNYTWAIIGLVGLIVIGFIPSKKKKNN